jgi:hypothetical protein
MVAATRLARSLRAAGLADGLEPGHPRYPLVATVEELIDERDVRDVIAARRRAALRLDDADGSSAALAAVLDVTDRVLRPIAAAALVVGAELRFDPDAISVAYDDVAGIGAVGWLHHEVAAVPSDRPVERTVECTLRHIVWPLADAWCGDAGLASCRARPAIAQVARSVVTELRARSAAHPRVDVTLSELGAGLP